jgi:hypothetical protein
MLLDAMPFEALSPDKTGSPVGLSTRPPQSSQRSVPFSVCACSARISSRDLEGGETRSANVSTPRRMITVIPTHPNSKRPQNGSRRYRVFQFPVHKSGSDDPKCRLPSASSNSMRCHGKQF